MQSYIDMFSYCYHTRSQEDFCSGCMIKESNVGFRCKHKVEVFKIDLVPADVTR